MSVRLWCGPFGELGEGPWTLCSLACYICQAILAGCWGTVGGESALGFVCWLAARPGGLCPRGGQEDGGAIRRADDAVDELDQGRSRRCEGDGSLRA